MKDVILITGCSGRIGFKVAERFSEKYQIVGFDVYLVGNLPSIEFVAVDIASNESVKQGLHHVKKTYGDRLAAVIHLAAYYSFAQKESENYERITVKGTERLLEGLQEFHVEQFIFSSTMLVHKPCAPGSKINEDSPLLPTWGYPRSKVRTEELIREKHGEIPVVIQRIAGVYDDRCHSIPLSHQMQRIFENQLEAHLFAGDITHGASYIHMDDVVEAFWLCVEKRRELPKELVLLIGEDKTCSYDELQRMMQKAIYGKEWKTWSLPKWVAKMGTWCMEHLLCRESFIKPWMIDISDDHYELDVSRAERLLGWKPHHSVDKAIPAWAQELKEDPVMWYDENKLRAHKKLGE